MNKLYTILKTLINKVNNTVSTDTQNLSEVQKQQVKSNLAISTADWNENNPESSAYIKGRTHWAETEEVTIYEGTPEFTLFSGELMDNREVFCYDAYDYPLPDLFQSSPGARPDAVTITVNDVSYNVLICPHYTALEQFKCKIENGYIAITTSVGYNALNIYVTEELTNMPLKITCDITTYTCLDEKYIPDSIARACDYLPINTKKTLTQTQVHNARANIKLDTPDWGETNSALPSYIKNKTHGYSRATYTAFNSQVSSGALDDSGYVTITAVLRLPYYNNAAKGVFTRCGSFHYNNITTDFTLDTQFLHGDMSVRINSSTVQYNGAYYFITASIIMEVEEAFVNKNIRVNLYYDELRTLDDKYISSNIARIEDTVVPVTISASSSSYAWTASTSAISSYSNGLVILGKVPNISSGPSITLKINSLAAYTIYAGAGTLTNQIPVGTYILLRCNTTTQRWEVINYIDTRNTVGNSITSSRLTLVGVTSNSNHTDSSIKSYVRPTCYIDTDGCLYSNSAKVSTVDDLDAISAKLPYVITGTCDFVEYRADISYDSEELLSKYNNGSEIILNVTDSQGLVHPFNLLTADVEGNYFTFVNLNYGVYRTISLCDGLVDEVYTEQINTVTADLTQAGQAADAKTVGDKLATVDAKLPYIIKGTYQYTKEGNIYAITQYDSEQVLATYNNGGVFELYLTSTDGSNILIAYPSYVHIDGLLEQSFAFISTDDCRVLYLALYNGEVDEVIEVPFASADASDAYVITGDCTVADSSIECSLDTTPDIEKIRDCMLAGKPCYLYLRDLDDNQYRIFTPVMDYDADACIQFKHINYDRVFIINLDPYDPTSMSGNILELVTRNSVYTTQVNGSNHGIFDRVSDYYIPTNAMVVNALQNRWNSCIITNNADGTYSTSVTFTNLTDIINKGREVVFEFTDCTGRKVVVPQINREVSNNIDGKLYYYFSLVYPGLTEDTWNNTYRVFISINSSNELVVKHDVISNATTAAVTNILNNLE